MKFRAVKFKETDEVQHILEHKFGETWQVVATKPDAFSPMLGLYLIRNGGRWFRSVMGQRTDAFGRKFPELKSVAIVVLEDNPVNAKGLITETKVK